MIFALHITYIKHELKQKEIALIYNYTHNIINKTIYIIINYDDYITGLSLSYGKISYYERIFSWNETLLTNL